MPRIGPPATLLVLLAFVTAACSEPLTEGQIQYCLDESVRTEVLMAEFAETGDIHPLYFEHPILRYDSEQNTFTTKDGEVLPITVPSPNDSSKWIIGPAVEASGKELDQWNARYLEWASEEVGEFERLCTKFLER